jgi:hypothetical protein
VRNNAPDAGEGGLRGFAAGVGKEGTKTLLGAAKLFETATGIPIHQAAEAVRKATLGDTDLETHGMAEGAGGVAENIVEFAGGDEALKGVLKGVDVLSKLPQGVRAIAEAHPKLLKALMNVTKGAAVGGVQGGVKDAEEGKALEGAKEGAEGAARGTGAGEAVGAVVKPVAKAAGLMSTAEDDITRAAKPGKRNTNFRPQWLPNFSNIRAHCGIEIMPCLRSWLQCVSRLRSFHCHQVRSKMERHLPFAARFAGNIGPRSNSPDTGGRIDTYDSQGGKLPRIGDYRAHWRGADQPGRRAAPPSDLHFRHLRERSLCTHEIKKGPRVLLNSGGPGRWPGQSGKELGSTERLLHALVEQHATEVSRYGDGNEFVAQLFGLPLELDFQSLLSVGVSGSPDGFARVPWKQDDASRCAAAHQTYRTGYCRDTRR